MPANAIQHFYYTRRLPARAVPLAQITSAPLGPDDLTDINNDIYLPASLRIWKQATPDTSPADFTAPDLNQAVAISGSLTYRVDNQFFELTSQTAADQTPLFYQHVLPAGVTGVTILDLAGNLVTTPTLQSGNVLYHSLDGAPYYVRYTTSTGFTAEELVLYSPVFSATPYVASDSTYVRAGRLVTVNTTATLYIRFVAQGGYQVLPPYNAQPNVPWFARIRFPLSATPPEYAVQVFLPSRPYQLAAWVPGTVLSSSLIEFERKKIYYDPNYLPDILVFDKDYVFKYALAGSAPNLPQRRGSLYNWRRGQISGIDPEKARIEVAVELATDDIVYAFYSYAEPDVVYRALDLNPFTNPAIANKIVEFYYKSDGADSFHVLYHQVLDPVTGPITSLTNDPSPGTGTKHLFSTLMVGSGVSPAQLTLTDIRSRGGGLKPQYQNIPQADSFWDIGYLDGRPFPIGGALAVYVPSAILNTMSRADVQARVSRCLPAGALPVIRYYTSAGDEFI